MKNFVAFTTQFFKNSNAQGELGHVNRVFNENKNAFPEYTKNNFGDDDLFNKYKEIYKRVNERKKELKLKRLNEKSNTFIDGVAVFSLDQWEELEKKHSPEEIKELVTERMNLFMSKFKDQFGFEPIGFNMHLDEGHEKNQLVRNIHAHVSFFNYDFKKDKAPLRNINKKETAKMQDLLAESFEDLGFRRGIPKEKTKKNHLEKDDFIKEKQRLAEEKIEELQEKIGDLELEVGLLESDNEEQEKKLEEVKKNVVVAEKKFERLKKQGYEFIKKAFKIVSNKLKGIYQENEKSYKNDINDYSNAFIDYSKADKKIAEDLHKKNQEHFDEQIKKDIDEDIKRKSRNKPKPKNNI